MDNKVVSINEVQLGLGIHLFLTFLLRGVICYILATILNVREIFSGQKLFLISIDEFFVKNVFFIFNVIFTMHFFDRRDRKINVGFILSFIIRNFVVLLCYIIYFKIRQSALPVHYLSSVFLLFLSNILGLLVTMKYLEDSFVVSRYHPIEHTVLYVSFINSLNISFFLGSMLTAFLFLLLLSLYPKIMGIQKRKLSEKEVDIIIVHGYTLFGMNTISVFVDEKSINHHRARFTISPYFLSQIKKIPSKNGPPRLISISSRKDLKLFEQSKKVFWYSSDQIRGIMLERNCLKDIELLYFENGVTCSNLDEISSKYFESRFNNLHNFSGVHHNLEKNIKNIEIARLANILKFKNSSNLPVYQPILATLRHSYNLFTLQSSIVNLFRVNEYIIQITTLLTMTMYMGDDIYQWKEYSRNFRSMINWAEFVFGKAFKNKYAVEVSPLSIYQHIPPKILSAILQIADNILKEIAEEKMDKMSILELEKIQDCIDSVRRNAGILKYYEIVTRLRNFFIHEDIEFSYFMLENILALTECSLFFLLQTTRDSVKEEYNKLTEVDLVLFESNFCKIHSHFDLRGLQVFEDYLYVDQ